jgi:nitrate reductase alpha subunit
MIGMRIGRPPSRKFHREQTDGPESADWYNATYLIMWGANWPMTRTSADHVMVQARYNGTKVVGICPDYAEYIKFADVWLACRAGTDGALATAMTMTHVLLKEFYLDHPTSCCLESAKTYTNLPFLVALISQGNQWTAGRVLNATDLGDDVREAEWLFRPSGNTYRDANVLTGRRLNG